MKVLFLDVDGVLNKRSDFEVMHNDNLVLNYTLVTRLQKIIADTNCKIVVSSTWRILEDNWDFLKKHVDLYDATDQLPKCRGDQIQRWLNKHPEVTRYVIVDDDSDMLDSQLRHYVPTEMLYGLTDNAAYRITYRLNNDIPETLFIGETS